MYANHQNLRVLKEIGVEEHSTEHVVMIQYITNVTKRWIFFAVLDVQLYVAYNRFYKLRFFHINISIASVFIDMYMCH